jgi:transglutaminase-like putative cysteine protease
MLLKLTHTTELAYSDFISESVMELRMAPRQESDQHRLSFHLAIGPATNALSYFDWLGNTVHTFTVNSFHKQIRIVATSVVETEAKSAAELEALPDTWPLAANDYDYSCYDYLQFGGPVVDSPKLRELADLIRPERGTPMIHLAWRMLGGIYNNFEYRTGVTTAASPITDMLDSKAGVCQDFTHLMVGLGRALNIPSRYVSGLLHSEPGKYKGFAQSHAWCELLFPSVGWIGFDPTNNTPTDEHFVKVAIGRDYRDVPPNRGIYRGKADESIDVQVHSEELKNVPPELAAERYLNLDIPAYAQGSAGHREMVNQQQEQQQQ